MADPNANLAALIGSRICHDLISPIGAIANGLELLDMTGSMQGPELDLIADSAGHAGARIRFFRLAFGAAGPQPLGRDEILALLEDIMSEGRVRLHWNVSETLPRTEIRLAFLAILCCESALPRGGDVTIVRTGTHWQIEARGADLRMDADAWARLQQPAATWELTPADVQFGLLPLAARDLNRQVQVAQSDGQVILEI